MKLGLRCCPQWQPASLHALVLVVVLLQGMNVQGTTPGAQTTPFTTMSVIGDTTTTLEPTVEPSNKPSTPAVTTPATTTASTTSTITSTTTSTATSTAVATTLPVAFFTHTSRDLTVEVFTNASDPAYRMYMLRGVSLQNPEGSLPSDSIRLNDSLVNYDRLGQYPIQFYTLEYSAMPIRSTVEVVDTTSPVIANEADATFEAYSTTDAQEKAFNVVDNYFPSSELNVGFEVGDDFSVEFDSIGKQFIIQVTASDPARNAQTYNINVTIVDTTPPVIELGTTSYRLPSQPLTLPEYNVYDGRAPTGTITVEHEFDGQEDRTVIMLTATDAFGNKATANHTVIVLSQPRIEFNGTTIEYNKPRPWRVVAEPTWWDDVVVRVLDTRLLDGNVLRCLEQVPKPLSEAQVNVTLPTFGALSELDDVLVNAHDLDSLQVQVSVLLNGTVVSRDTRWLTFMDSVPPKLTILGPTFVLYEGSGPYSDPGVFAVDERSSKFVDVCRLVFFTSELDTSMTCNASQATIDYVGRHGDRETSLSSPSLYLPDTCLVIRYVTTDGLNTVVDHRVIDVQELSIPILTLRGDAEVSLNYGAQFQDPGVLAFDVREGDLENEVAVQWSAPLDTRSPGTYTATYSVTDGDGNHAAPVTRTITVQPFLEPSNPLNIVAIVLEMTLAQFPSTLAMQEAVASLLVGDSSVVLLRIYEAQDPSFVIPLFDSDESAGGEGGEGERKRRQDPEDALEGVSVVELVAISSTGQPLSATFTTTRLNGFQKVGDFPLRGAYLSNQVVFTRQETTVTTTTSTEGSTTSIAATTDSNTGASGSFVEAKMVGIVVGGVVGGTLLIVVVFVIVCNCACCACGERKAALSQDYETLYACATSAEALYANPTFNPSGGPPPPRPAFAAAAAPWAGTTAGPAGQGYMDIEAARRGQADVDDRAYEEPVGANSRHATMYEARLKARAQKQDEGQVADVDRSYEQPVAALSQAASAASNGTARGGESGSGGRHPTMFQPTSTAAAGGDEEHDGDGDYVAPRTRAATLFDQPPPSSTAAGRGDAGDFSMYGGVNPTAHQLVQELALAKQALPTDGSDPFSVYGLDVGKSAAPSSHEADPRDYVVMADSGDFGFGGDGIDDREGDPVLQTQAQSVSEADATPFGFDMYGSSPLAPTPEGRVYEQPHAETPNASEGVYTVDPAGDYEDVGLTNDIDEQPQIQLRRGSSQVTKVVFGTTVTDQFPWYHGLISREEAESRLGVTGRVGAYLVRLRTVKGEQGAQRNTFALSVLTQAPSTFKHHLLTEHRDGCFSFNSQRLTQCTSLPALLETVKLQKVATRVQLGEPCPPASDV
eukprot:m.85370 g.85370  ORF g.85370 m.85370 type:complete len:1335 (-) comp12778_c0_seq2:452-4456(-)